MSTPANEYEELRQFHLAGRIVYGPVCSRRFKLSLGINLLPREHKVCNFDCLYCECGWTDRQGMLSGRNFDLPTLKEIATEVAAEFKRLRQQGISPDWIVFSGNGEPTLHPDFPHAVAVVDEYRARYLPESETGILTNGTGLSNPEVFRAISGIHSRIVKLDAALERMDRPFVNFDLESLIPIWARLPRITIQSFFCEGRLGNTTDEDVDIWIGRIQRVRPRRVQLYTLDRVPAAHGMEKASLDCLTRIARRLAQKISVEVTVFD